MNKQNALNIHCFVWGDMYYIFRGGINGVSETLLKVGMCWPAVPYVSDGNVKYIVKTIKQSIK